MRKKVHQMLQKSPKDYLNYINSLNNKQSTPEIKLDTLLDIFKKLNNVKYGDDSSII